MEDDELRPIGELKFRFPVPPVGTHYWEQADWDTWIAQYGVREPLVLRYSWGVCRAIGRNAQGDLVYRVNTNGDVCDELQ